MSVQLNSPILVKSNIKENVAKLFDLDKYSAHSRNINFKINRNKSFSENISSESEKLSPDLSVEPMSVFSENVHDNDVKSNTTLHDKTNSLKKVEDSKSKKTLNYENKPLAKGSKKMAISSNTALITNFFPQFTRQVQNKFSK